MNIKTYALGLLFTMLVLPYQLKACELNDKIFNLNIAPNSKGLVFIVHGLNQKPEMMDGMVKLAKDKNYSQAVITLEGHHAEGSDLKMANLSKGCWEKQIAYAIEKISLIDELQGQKKIFLGFSLGGLLGIDYLKNNPKSFDQMILLAPAIKVKTHSHFIKFLFPFLKDSKIIKSMACEEERAAEGVSIQGYKELFLIQEKFNNNIVSDNINIPTEIFIHEKDELVSLEKLKLFAEKYQLNKWQIHSLDEEKQKGPKTFYHQITVPSHVNKTEWQNKVLSKITEIL
jgi:esterase/lipase